MTIQQPQKRVPPWLKQLITDLQSATIWRMFFSNGYGHVTELALGADNTVLKSTGAATAPEFAAVDATELAAGTQGDTLYAGASGVWAKLGAGTSGYFLKTQGAGANPIWAQPSMASISDLPVIASGVYTPTRSAEVNLDANVTMSEAQYLRVGATVTVSGRFTADPTTTSTTSSFEFTLPVASNLGAVEDLAGVAFCGAIAAQGAAIYGSVANNTAVVDWKAADVTNQTWSMVFSYQIL